MTSSDNEIKHVMLAQKESGRKRKEEKPFDFGGKVSRIFFPKKKKCNAPEKPPREGASTSHSDKGENDQSFQPGEETQTRSLSLNGSDAASATENQESWSEEVLKFDTEIPPKDDPAAVSEAPEHGKDNSPPNVLRIDVTVPPEHFSTFPRSKASPGQRISITDDIQPPTPFMDEYTKWSNIRLKVGEEDSDRSATLPRYEKKPPLPKPIGKHQAIYTTTTKNLTRKDRSLSERANLDATPKGGHKITISLSDIANEKHYDDGLTPTDSQALQIQDGFATFPRRRRHMISLSTEREPKFMSGIVMSNSTENLRQFNDDTTITTGSSGITKIEIATTDISQTKPPLADRTDVNFVQVNFDGEEQLAATPKVVETSIGSTKIIIGSENKTGDLLNNSGLSHTLRASSEQIDFRISPGGESSGTRITPISISSRSSSEGRLHENADILVRTGKTTRLYVAQADNQNPKTADLYNGTSADAMPDETDLGNRAVNGTQRLSNLKKQKRIRKLETLHKRQMMSKTTTAGTTTTGLVLDGLPPYKSSRPGSETSDCQVIDLKQATNGYFVGKTKLKSDLRRRKQKRSDKSRRRPNQGSQESDTDSFSSSDELDANGDDAPELQGESDSGFDVLIHREGQKDKVIRVYDSGESESDNSAESGSTVNIYDDDGKTIGKLTVIEKTRFITIPNKNLKSSSGSDPDELESDLPNEMPDVNDDLESEPEFGTPLTSDQDGANTTTERGFITKTERPVAATYLLEDERRVISYARIEDLEDHDYSKPDDCDSDHKYDEKGRDHRYNSVFSDTYELASPNDSDHAYDKLKRIEKPVLENDQKQRTVSERTVTINEPTNSQSAKVEKSETFIPPKRTASKTVYLEVDDTKNRKDSSTQYFLEIEDDSREKIDEKDTTNESPPEDLASILSGLKRPTQKHQLVVEEMKQERAQRDHEPISFAEEEPDISDLKNLRGNRKEVQPIVVEDVEKTQANRETLPQRLGVDDKNWNSDQHAFFRNIIKFNPQVLKNNDHIKHIANRIGANDFEYLERKYNVLRPKNRGISDKDRDDLAISLLEATRTKFDDFEDFDGNEKDTEAVLEPKEPVLVTQHVEFQVESKALDEDGEVLKPPSKVLKQIKKKESLKKKQQKKVVKELDEDEAPFTCLEHVVENVEKHVTFKVDIPNFKKPFLFPGESEELDPSKRPVEERPTELPISDDDESLADSSEDENVYPDKKPVVKEPTSELPKFNEKVEEIDVIDDDGEDIMETVDDKGDRSVKSSKSIETDRWEYERKLAIETLKDDETVQGNVREEMGPSFSPVDDAKEKEADEWFKRMTKDEAFKRRNHVERDIDDNVVFETRQRRNRNDQLDDLLKLEESMPNVDDRGDTKDNLDDLEEFKDFANRRKVVARSLEDEVIEERMISKNVSRTKKDLNDIAENLERIQFEALKKLEKPKVEKKIIERQLVDDEVDNEHAYKMVQRNESNRKSVAEELVLPNKRGKEQLEFPDLDKLKPQEDLPSDVSKSSRKPLNESNKELEPKRTSDVLKDSRRLVDDEKDDALSSHVQKFGSDETRSTKTSEDQRRLKSQDPKSEQLLQAKSTPVVIFEGQKTSGHASVQEKIYRVSGDVNERSETKMVRNNGKQTLTDVKGFGFDPENERNELMTRKKKKSITRSRKSFDLHSKEPKADELRMVVEPDSLTFEQHDIEPIRLQDATDITRLTKFEPKSKSTREREESEVSQKLQEIIDDLDETRKSLDDINFNSEVFSPDDRNRTKTSSAQVIGVSTLTIPPKRRVVPLQEITVHIKNEERDARSPRSVTSDDPNYQYYEHNFDYKRPYRIQSEDDMLQDESGLYRRDYQYSSYDRYDHHQDQRRSSTDTYADVELRMVALRELPNSPVPPAPTSSSLGSPRPFFDSRLVTSQPNLVHPVAVNGVEREENEMLLRYKRLMTQKHRRPDPREIGLIRRSGLRHGHLHTVADHKVYRVPSMDRLNIPRVRIPITSVQTTVNSEHNEEQLIGNIIIWHPDGNFTVNSPDALNIFDTYEEFTSLGVTPENVAQIAMKVFSQSVVLINAETNHWLRRTIVVTKMVEIDLNESYEHQYCYESICKIVQTQKEQEAVNEEEESQLELREINTQLLEPARSTIPRNYRSYGKQYRMRQHHHHRSVDNFG